MLAFTSAMADAPPSNEAQNPSTLNEIVVTAQKRSENLQNVPIAVTAITSAELSASNIETQQSLPRLTPNLNFTQESQFVSAYIRGVGTTYALPGLESSVSVYLDDAYMARASSALFSLNDVERIEVLKGPQGTLYGRNATGGAIRIITNDPQPGFEANYAVTYGTDNRLAVESMVNIPIDERVELRVAALHDKDDGYVRNLAPGGRTDLNDRNEDDIRAKLLIKPFDNFRINLSGDYMSKRDADGDAYTNLFPGAPEQIGAALGGGVSHSFYGTYSNTGSDGKTPKTGANIFGNGGTLRIDYDVGPATLSSITIYRYLSEMNLGDVDATGADLENFGNSALTKQYTQELQATSHWSYPVNYVAGLYYLRETASDLANVSGDAIGPGLDFAGAGLVHVTSLAPYAQLDYAVSDRFSIIGGARYTKETKDLIYSEGIIGPLAPDGNPGPGATAAPLGVCTAPGETLCAAPRARNTFDQFTPKLTLSYKPAEGYLLYATYAKGFKSGGFSLPAFGTPDSVKPETLDDYELGWKMETGTFRFNGAAFYYKYRDLQIAVIDPNTSTVHIENAAAANPSGVEFDFTWAPLRAVELGAGGGYLNAKYTSFTGDDYVPCGQVPDLSASTAGAIAGKQAAIASCAKGGGLGLADVAGRNLDGYALPNSPRFSGYLRGQFTQPLSAGLGTITFSSILNYRSVAYFDQAQRYADRSRTLLSANLTWKSAHSRYFLSLYGENLTGVEYNEVVTLLAIGGFRVPAPPRQLYVKTGVSF